MGPRDAWWLISEARRNSTPGAFPALASVTASATVICGALGYAWWGAKGGITATMVAIAWWVLILYPMGRDALHLRDVEAAHAPDVVPDWMTP